jgi:hypothetical protein
MRCRRTIVAQVTLDGMPNANFTVTQFTVKRLPRLAPVRGLRIHRRGRVLRISWHPAAGALRYAVDVHGTDGRMHSFTVSEHRHSAVVSGIGRSVAGSVVLTPLRARDRGPHASARFRALGRLRTGVHR